MEEAAALIVAAGRGRRFGGEVPKPYAALGGLPLLRHSLAAFARHPRIGAVRAVIHPDDRDHYALAAQGLGLLPPVDGGPSRQASVRLGLESLAGSAPERVLIHDAARPLITDGLISRVLAALDTVPGPSPRFPSAIP